MAGYRAERLAELIHREVAQRLRLVVKDPRLEPISITRVEVSGDLGQARILYLPLGGGEASEDLQEALDGAARALRGPLGRDLRVRRSPQLIFELDVHFEEAVHVAQLLDRIGEDLRDGDEEEE